MVKDSVDIVWKYFNPDTEQLRVRMSMLAGLYRDLNQKVNVISRKDIDYFYLHHVLHSLALAKLRLFKPDQQILDLGTGGGFPGIPLGIFYPECHFTLIDGTQKKIRVVQTVIDRLELTNVQAIAVRSEDFRGQFDYVVSRAVASASEIWHWGKKLVKHGDQVKHQRAPRFLLLKGGDLTQELQDFPLNYVLHPIQQYFEESYFREKYILSF
jgi:16S rRNA (guanine527-N7)-methyltransferase